MARNIMILWRWSEALECEGESWRHFGSVGGQMKGVKEGDRLFVCATTDGELYLLGLVQVKDVKKGVCRNLSGTFKRLPLEKRKWQLRFVNTDASRLDPNVRLASQVRVHRVLSDESADLLARMLGKDVAAVEREFRFQEGERRAAQMARCVRSPGLRVEAKRHWGQRCYCCGFSFEEFYGAVGTDFAIVHHLEPLGDGQSRETSVNDVRIVCANCHYILHRQDPPLSVETLKQQFSRKWTAWSRKGIKAR